MFLILFFFVVLTVFLYSIPELSEHIYNQCLNSFSGYLVISISLRFNLSLLSCSFVWNVFLCLLILFDFVLQIRQNHFLSQSPVGDSIGGLHVASAFGQDLEVQGWAEAFFRACWASTCRGQNWSQAWVGPELEPDVG